MTLAIVPYLEQKQRWPREGRHILAHFDADSVVVYQAYRASIGHFATREGYFGGEWSLNRMSWFKPNFLWMMYRSGWGTKPDQEVTLAIRLRREFFEAVLAQAVPSNHDADLYPDREAWKEAVASSTVRLQWDPDHAPSGQALPRRAIQLGLRGEMLKQFSREAILGIEDISDFVASQRVNNRAENYEKLLVPAERIYLPAAPTLTKLRMSDEAVA